MCMSPRQCPLPLIRIHPASAEIRRRFKSISKQEIQLVLQFLLVSARARSDVCIVNAVHLHHGSHPSLSKCLDKH